MAKIKYVIFIFLIIIAICSTEIIQKTKNIDTKINCYNQKLAMVNKFAVGNSKKLIACLKAKAEKNSRTF